MAREFISTYASTIGISWRISNLCFRLSFHVSTPLSMAYGAMYIFLPTVYQASGIFYVTHLGFLQVTFLVAPIPIMGQRFCYDYRWTWPWMVSTVSTCCIVNILAYFFHGKIVEFTLAHIYVICAVFFCSSKFFSWIYYYNMLTLYNVACNLYICFQNWLFPFQFYLFLI